jgi:hypothetical protein
LAAWVKTQDPRPCGHVAGQGRGGDGQAAEEGGSFDCAACNKRYKNAQQLANHEKSGKHKQIVAKLNRQLKEDDGLKELEELAVEEGEHEEEEGALGDEERGDAAVGGGRGRKKKGRRNGGPAAGGPAAGEGAGADAADDDDAAIAAAMSIALPSPGLVALQTRQAFESTDEYKKMNKTQRRKALLQWEAENEHVMEALRSEGKEPKPEGVPKEKKPDVPEVREKLHGAGAHSRESKTPKAKQKAVYGKPKN